MRSRWKVEQESDWLNGTYWVAWQPDKEWKALAPKFHTHDDALFYADRMARTIRATLSRPRNCTKIPLPEGHENQAPIWVNSSGRDATISYTAGRNHGSIYVRHGELEPLALTLLTLSRKDTP